MGLPNRTGISLSAVLVNEFMNFPSLEGADDAQPEWWEEDHANATLTEVDIAGETITESYERGLKVVVSSGAHWAYQRFTYADQWRVKSGVQVTMLVAVWSVSSASARVGFTTSTPTSSFSAPTTSAAWNLHRVTGTCDGTYVDAIFEVTAGTAYFVPLALVVGTQAVALPPRGTTPRWRDFGADHDIDFTADSGGFIDADVTAFTHNLAVMADLFFSIEVPDGNANLSYELFVRRNGSAVSANDSNKVASTRTNTTNGRDSARSNGMFSVLLDDGQIFEYDFNHAEGVTNAGGLSGMSVARYWVWA